MAGTRQIKRRIKSATNIAQITKAMEMVAASKMRRAQEQAVLSRPYADKLVEMTVDLAERVSPRLHPLLVNPELDQTDLRQKKGVVLITPDKGLCGGLVSNLGKEIAALGHCQYVVVGKKGKELVLKLGYRIVAEFDLGLAQPSFDFVIPIARVVTEGFVKGDFGEVLLVYTHFETTLSQHPARRQLLPISLLKAREPGQLEYLFEPSPDDILKAILPHYVEIQLYQVILEATASEHSARMVAMKNANENAAEIVKELRLVFNELRQQQITREIADVVTARMALE